MAIKTDVVVTNDVFQGEDKQLDFTVYQDDNVTPENIAAWSMEWLLVATDASEINLIKKTSVLGGITINTPHAVVLLNNTDLAAIAAGTYFHVLWRVNAGFHTVLAYGSFALRDAPQP